MKRSRLADFLQSDEARSVSLPRRAGPLLRDLGDMFPVDCVYARS